MSCGHSAFPQRSGKESNRSRKPEAGTPRRPAYARPSTFRNTTSCSPRVIPPAFVSQNRAWTYDASHGLVLMVLGGARGNQGKAQVYALRYGHPQASAGR
jgi:hypothetical protein